MTDSASPDTDRCDVLVVRHGQSTWNVEGRWQGLANPPLTDLGRAQAGAAAQRLAGDAPFDAVWSSDLQRAWQTAQIVARRLGALPVRPLQGLREIAIGPWEGLTRAEIEAGWPGWVTASRRPEGAEPLASGQRRVVEALLAACRTGAHRRLLVVTHAGVIRLLRAHCGTTDRVLPNLCGAWFTVQRATGAMTTGDLVELGHGPAEETG